MGDEMIKKMTVLVWLLLAVAALGYVYQYGRSIQQTYPNRTFAVDGDAKLNLVPDIAKFSVSVVSEGARVTDVQKMNTEKMNAVQDFLKEIGVDKKDMKTEQYALNPRYEYSMCDTNGKCPAPRISGYTLTQELAVKVRDTDRLGDMLSGVTDKGANSVSNVTFDVDDDKVARSEARAEAMAEAKKKAKTLAKTAGFRLGKLVTLYESTSPMMPYYGMGGDSSMKAMEMSAVSPVIEPGTQNTKVQVTLTYEIKN